MNKLTSNFEHTTQNQDKHIHGHAKFSKYDYQYLFDILHLYPKLIFVKSYLLHRTHIIITYMPIPLDYMPT